MSMTVTSPETANGAAPPQVPAAAPKPPAQKLIVHDNGPLAHLFDTARFEQLHRLATGMARATLIPDHLRIAGGRELPFEQIQANCFLIVNQSVRWGLDPFMVAPETYVVGGKLGFQGKLIAALVNSKAGLKERLRYAFSGEKDNRTVTVIGTFDGESEPRTVDLCLRDAKTGNKMWTSDPDQKLIYSGVTKWARRHCPEIMLGVLTDDDLERMAASQAKLIDAREVPTGSKSDRLAESIPTTPGDRAEESGDSAGGRSEQNTQQQQQSEADPNESSQETSSDAGEESQDREPAEGEMSPEELLKEAMCLVAESTGKRLKEISDEYRERLGVEGMKALSDAIATRKAQIAEDAKQAKDGKLL